MKHITLIACLAAVLLLAMAVPALAEPSGSSGIVYGKAVLAPYAVTISGGGTESFDPLTYEGSLGQQVNEKYGSQVTAQNTGTQAAQLRLDVSQLPSDGNSTWDLDVGSGMNTASWIFWGYNGIAQVLPSNNYYYGSNSVLSDLTYPGQADTYNTSFRFPTSSSSTADHYMAATLSVVAPY